MSRCSRVAIRSSIAAITTLLVVGLGRVAVSQTCPVNCPTGTLVSCAAYPLGNSIVVCQGAGNPNWYVYGPAGGLLASGFLPFGGQIATVASSTGCTAVAVGDGSGSPGGYFAVIDPNGSPVVGQAFYSSGPITALASPTGCIALAFPSAPSMPGAQYFVFDPNGALASTNQAFYTSGPITALASPTGCIALAFPSAPTMPGAQYFVFDPNGVLSSTGQPFHGTGGQILAMTNGLGCLALAFSDPSLSSPSSYYVFDPGGALQTYGQEPYAPILAVPTNWAAMAFVFGSSSVSWRVFGAVGTPTGSGSGGSLVSATATSSNWIKISTCASPTSTLYSYDPNGYLQSTTNGSCGGGGGGGGQSWVGCGAGGYNFLSFNNGSEDAIRLPGQNTSAGSPNLYYRCYPDCVLYPPQCAGNFVGLDASGWQWASARSVAGGILGTPLFFHVTDPSLTCILSAAAGGGFPPAKDKIRSSANTLASYYFYTSVPCAFPTGWWFSFAGSAAFEVPGPTAGGGNLLCGWSDKNVTTTFNFQYAVGSTNEATSAKSRSFANLNAAGLSILRLGSRYEWEFELETLEPAVNPEVHVGGSFDSGGTSGYSPTVGGSSKLRFRTMYTADAGTGYATINVANLFFQVSCQQCHVPGFANLRVNVDILWITMFSLFFGTAYTPPSGVGPFWNPNFGWTPGGESVSPVLPITAAGLVGLQMCFGSLSFKLGIPPLTNGASNGSQLRFR